jgi:tRNA threonylcarbamoyladenosine biosynthesis protein TsaB
VLTLAIETSSPLGSIAVGNGNQLLAERRHAGGDAHAEALFPLLDELLREAGVSRKELGRVAVGVGPGSFTGLRVGIALAEGIATGLGIPLLGVPSLASLAWSRAAGDVDVIGALLDARRQDVFFAAFSPDQGVHAEAELLSGATARARIERQMAGKRFILSGVPGLGGLPNEWFLADAEYPTAEALLKLCDGPLAQSDAAPLYLRAPDIKLPNLPPNPLTVLSADEHSRTT